jgi:hypothetical protein
MSSGMVVGSGERRGVFRHIPAVGELPVVVEAGAQLRPVAVDNISPCGVAVRLERPVDPGTLLPVQLLNRNGNFWHLKLMCVVHVTPGREGGWLVGNQFLARFTDDEFRVLLAAGAGRILPSP